MKDFLKKYMIAGILVLVPVVVTIWVLKVVIFWMDDFAFALVPRQFRPAALLGYEIPGLGLMLTLALILSAGVFTRLYIGKKFVGLGDRIFARVPFGRSIYQATKQVLNTAFSEDQKQRSVVLVEYPKENSYAIGFMTGRANDHLWERDATSMVVVFVPTAPNPTSGFLLVVPESAVIKTHMTTEEASKIIISGGLLAKSREVG